MNQIKRLASKNPLVFSFGITLTLILMVIISAVAANRQPPETDGWYLAATVGRVVSIVLFLALLSGLGWLLGAGFTRLGRLQTWLLLFLPLVYAIAVTVYALTGSLEFNISNPGLTVSVTLFIFAAAFLEEVAFRGLILHAFVRVWGETNRGLIKSVLVAALFFGAYHISNILGGMPIPDAVLQGVANVCMGIFLGALVLHGRSIYPAVFFHGFWNLGGYLNLTSSTAWGTPASWLLLSVLFLPLTFFGLYLLRDAWQRALVLDTV